jgi:predicted nucleotidyltransferase
MKNITSKERVTGERMRHESPSSQRHVRPRNHSLYLDSASIISVLEQNRDILRQFGLIRIGLFGSYLKGKGSPDSDIDFIVAFNKATFDNYMDLKFALERIFKRKVDLVIEGNLKPALRYVEKEAAYAKGI